MYSPVLSVFVQVLWNLPTSQQPWNHPVPRWVTYRDKSLIKFHKYLVKLPFQFQLQELAIFRTSPPLVLHHSRDLSPQSTMQGMSLSNTFKISLKIYSWLLPSATNSTRLCVVSASSAQAVLSLPPCKTNPCARRGITGDHSS